MKGRLPDYRLSFLNKVTEAKGQIGAAWRNEDNSISIVLDPKVVLTQTKDEILTLFPERPGVMADAANSTPARVAGIKPARGYNPDTTPF